VEVTDRTHNDTELITAVKSFKGQAPGLSCLRAEGQMKLKLFWKKNISIKKYFRQRMKTSGVDDTKTLFSSFAEK
jgi:hypothetical protein